MGVIHFAGTSIPPQFGTGADGNITIVSGTVNIEDLYEDENVAGVTTKLGVGKGLNKGAGTYDPENEAYINAINFTIDSGATLTHGTAYGAGASNKNGIIWIACTGSFTNEGTIDMDALGASGGAGGAGHPSSAATGGTGEGSGGGVGGTGGRDVGGPGTGGAGGSSYGSAPIPITTWADLYGSGGGGGGGGSNNEAGGGGGGAGHITSGVNGSNGASDSGGAAGAAGGSGGGAIRIFANLLVTSSGDITCDGAVGSNAAGGFPNGGGGGGGSAGTVYLETLSGATLGTDKITCSAGAGGTSAGGGGAGGAGKQGRIHIEGTYTGSTSDPAIA